jgi:uncharacterized protein YijF (DUF1287 family)
LKTLPSLSAEVRARIDANETVVPLARDGRWAKVRVGADVEGYVEAAALSDVWIQVWKRERQLLLMKGGRIVDRYGMALGAENADADKQRRGDGATPLGRFYIAEADARPDARRYGARSLRLSYPGVRAARRGLADGVIDYPSYVAIVRDVRAGRVPPQDTALGGSIRIHGGGGARDWTLGCLALADADVIDLFKRVPPGTRVDIYASGDEAAALARAEHTSAELLAGARRQLERPALYTRRAMGYLPLSFPGGDIDPGEAMCADVVVRAGRAAALDLQALVHEDRLVHPELYDARDGGPSQHIDHRRVRNLARFFSRHALRPTREPARAPGSDFLPGDIVLFETGINNGTLFDHIGVVDDQRDDDGFPRVINIWTVGAKTASIRLLGDSYPTATAHFRLRHRYDYE